MVNIHDQSRLCCRVKDAFMEEPLHYQWLINILSQLQMKIIRMHLVLQCSQIVNGSAICEQINVYFGFVW